MAVTWVHSGTGVRTPIARFARVVAAANRGRAEQDRAILCVEVDGVSPEAVVERLQQRKVIASVTPRAYEMHLARLSPSLLTSPADVEASLRAVREIV